MPLDQIAQMSLVLPISCCPLGADSGPQNVQPCQRVPQGPGHIEQVPRMGSVSREGLAWLGDSRHGDTDEEAKSRSRRVSSHQLNPIEVAGAHQSPVESLDLGGLAG